MSVSAFRKKRSEVKLAATLQPHCFNRHQEATNFDPAQCNSSIFNHAAYGIICSNPEAFTTSTSGQVRTPRRVSGQVSGCKARSESRESALGVFKRSRHGSKTSQARTRFEDPKRAHLESSSKVQEVLYWPCSIYAIFHLMLKEGGHRLEHVKRSTYKHGRSYCFRWHASWKERFA